MFEDHKIRKMKLRTRMIYTSIFSMIALLFIVLGHLYVTMLVIGLAFVSYREIISLKRIEEKDQKSIFSWIDWYYFATFTFGVFPHILIKNK